MEEQIIDLGQNKTGTKIIRGKRKDGTLMVIRVDPKLQKVLNEARKRNTRNWDYVALVCGYSGAGKSTFAQSVARYLDPGFDESRIAFTAEQFIRITNEVPEYSSVVLDESFESLNSKITMSSAFLKIVNHLQIIRKKRLFIFLCLPNFFDLSKGVAIFRASHLFLIYAADDGTRGRFVAFDRNAKRLLYIKGGKYIDYNAVRGNFYGKYYEDRVIPEEIYEGMKDEHRNIQDLNPSVRRKQESRDNLINFLRVGRGWKIKEIANASKLSEGAVKQVLYKKRTSK